MEKVIANIANLFHAGLESAAAFISAAAALATALRDAAGLKNGRELIIRALNDSPLTRGATKPVRALISQSMKSIRVQLHRAEKKPEDQRSEYERNLLALFKDNKLHFDGVTRQFSWKKTVKNAPAHPYQDLIDAIPALQNLSKGDDVTLCIIRQFESPSQHAEQYDAARRKVVELQAQLETALRQIADLTSKISKISKTSKRA